VRASFPLASQALFNFMGVLLLSNTCGASNSHAAEGAPEVVVVVVATVVSEGVAEQGVQAWAGAPTDHALSSYSAASHSLEHGSTSVALQDSVSAGTEP